MGSRGPSLEKKSVNLGGRCGGGGGAGQRNVLDAEFGSGKGWKAQDGRFLGETFSKNSARTEKQPGGQGGGSVQRTREFGVWLSLKGGGNLAGRIESRNEEEAKEQKEGRRRLGQDRDTVAKGQRPKWRVVWEEGKLQANI